MKRHIDVDDEMYYGIEEGKIKTFRDHIQPPYKLGEGVCVYGCRDFENEIGATEVYVTNVTKPDEDGFYVVSFEPTGEEGRKFKRR